MGSGIEKHLMDSFFYETSVNVTYSLPANTPIRSGGGGGGGGGGPSGSG